MTTAYTPQHFREHDPTFVQDLQFSMEAVDKTAAWLRAQGYTVTVKPLRVRPDESQMAAYADDGDMEIVQRVECKRRLKQMWTGPADYPYPNVLVDNAHHFDKARPKPYAYCIWNRDLTALIVVHSHTRDKWERKTIYDSGKKRYRTIYSCPVELVRFVRVAP